MILKLKTRTEQKDTRTDATENITTPHLWAAANPISELKLKSKIFQTKEQ